MRINEILLPASMRDKSISPAKAKRLDMLQTRMDSYVDKIGDEATTTKNREFLKTKLKADLADFRDTLKEVMEDAAPVATQYEVYDRKTGLKVGGPYSTLKRARGVVDKKDNEYGAYRYGHREVKPLTECVNKIPLSDEDFEFVKEIMSRPIPAAVAQVYIQEVINDDELTGELQILEDSEPGRDVRPLIADWVKRVMPDQLYRFGQGRAVSKDGVMSVIHGYDRR